MPTWGAVLTIFVTSCISFGAQTTVKTVAKYADRGIVRVVKTARHPKHAAQVVAKQVSK